MILLGEQGNCPCVHAIGYQCSQNDWRQYVPLDSHQQIEKNRRHSRKTFDLKGIFRSKQSGSFLGNLTSQWNKKQAPDSLCCISIGKRILIRSYWTHCFTSQYFVQKPLISQLNFSSQNQQKINQKIAKINLILNWSFQTKYGLLTQCAW